MANSYIVPPLMNTVSVLHSTVSARNANSLRCSLANAIIKIKNNPNSTEKPSLPPIAVDRLDLRQTDIDEMPMFMRLSNQSEHEKAAGD